MLPLPYHAVFLHLLTNVKQSSAGGGGKTPYRNEKIRAKNDKLREERARRMKAELEAKHKEDEQDGIHPSRRAQMHRSQHADAQ
ncbi:hypothetical protein MCOR29_011458 [Pyricularia oryzae]|nr:hypothetical protein MCOR29_011458 [Pyricularia oryzae]KAI6340799.1 hypothetical protein MCOR30_002345 [Pyricularia oryzae]KAI6378961.1 hypothetical protein MCOR32_004605 [Pyricularia oryzae]KAI6441962.1 hypothetical protein MCOR17_011666 [Pyricularia oryzae]KAI6549150.1 hypothetical protein MCOR09_011604 [Pyricularia oryzae]